MVALSSYSPLAIAQDVSYFGRMENETPKKPDTQNPDAKPPITDDAWLNNEKSMRWFLIGKYAFENMTLSIMVIATLLACHKGLIDKTVTGTLLGAIFGFFGRGIRKIHDK